jgi:hypothetical protein
MGPFEGIIMRFDKDFVYYWSKRYVDEELGDSALEHELLNSTHQAIAAREYLTSSELTKIVTWKSQRTTGILEDDPDTIRDVTRVALASNTPEWMRHRILSILDGVGHPVASAILTIWDPDNHTVIDDRSVAALRKLWGLGLLPSEPPSQTNRYWTYLKVYRDIAADLGVAHRDLDRALWKWNKAGMPETWPGIAADRGDEGHADDDQDGRPATAS